MSREEMIAKLKAAKDGRDRSEPDRIHELPELPDIPKDDRKVSIMIPKRGRSQHAEES